MKHTLSPRQVEVMRRICRGLIAKEIAGELGISFRTVQTHLVLSKRKLKARTIAQAAFLLGRKAA